MTITKMFPPWTIQLFSHRVSFLKIGLGKLVRGI